MALHSYKALFMFAAIQAMFLGLYWLLGACARCSNVDVHLLDNRPRKKVLVTFNDAGGKYNTMALRVQAAALAHGFDEAVVYPYDRLPATWRHQQRKTLAIKRGHGHMCWKAYIVNDILLGLKDGDILCYSDSDVHFIRSAQPFFDEVLAAPERVTVYHNKPNEPVFTLSNWSKREAHRIVGYTPKVGPSRGNGYWVPGGGGDQDSWSGFMCVVASPRARRLIFDWLLYSQDYRVIVRDVPSKPEDVARGMITHQEDQTVWSLLAKKEGILFRDMPPSRVGPLQNDLCLDCSSCHTSGEGHKPGC